jgi:hypothetical protein
MSLWGNLEAANNAPKTSAIAGYGGSTPQVTSNAQVYYANTRINAFITDAAIGVFGVNASEQSNATSTIQGVPQHAGWVVRKVGTGPVVTITANSGAVAVNSFITFSRGDGISGSGNTAANARIFVNTAGYIMNVTVISGGEYANTPIATANTGNSALTVTVGGRAGRVQTETLVAMGSMTGDNDNIWGTPGA